MNLRQTQRTLAEVLAKCEELHVQLPVDPFDSMLGAGEALRHSRVGGKLHVDDAVDELKQRYGLQPKWQQLEDAAEAKRQKRQRRRLRRGDEEGEPQKSQDASTGRTMTSDTDSADTASSLESASRARKKLRTSAATNHGLSRIDRIIENNPAKNPANEELAEEFVELGGHELEHGEKQKGISRMAVAKQIRQATEPIKSGAEARKLPRIGPSAAAKIDEVLQRGKMKALEEYDDENDENQAAARSNQSKARSTDKHSTPLKYDQKHDSEETEKEGEGDNDGEHEKEAEDEHQSDDEDEDEFDDEEPDDRNDADWGHEGDDESAQDD